MTHVPGHIEVGTGIDLNGVVASYPVPAAPHVGSGIVLAPTAASGAITNVPKTVVETVIAENFYYEGTQTTPASEWTFTHNLGKRPNVTVYDSDGDEILIDVEHVNLNTIHIIWPVPTAGSVICS